MGERPNWRGYLFILPAFVHLTVFALIPIVYAAFLSLHRWNILKEGKPFVGLGNYLFLLQDEEFWNAMWNSARFALMSVPAGMLVALAVAILVNQRLRGVTLFRTIFYVPAISSGVAISMVWIWIYLPRNGLINFTAQLFGFSGTTDFLNDPTLAMPALVFMSIWVGLGPRMVLFIAGLAAIRSPSTRPRRWTERRAGHHSVMSPYRCCYRPLSSCSLPAPSPHCRCSLRCI